MNDTAAVDSMSPAVPQKLYTCLDAQAAHGLAALRAYLVDRIKRTAIHQLHATERGERFLLTMYLNGEKDSQQILHEKLALDLPAWLARQFRQHLAEEQRHVQLFAQALGLTDHHRAHRKIVTGLSWFKLRRWNRLTLDYQPQFAYGVLIPTLATALCAEQMACRVLRRHCDTIGKAHALYPLLSRVLADEQRHILLCAHTLQRLVAPAEEAELARLLRRARAIDASFGTCGALAMLAAGVVHRLLPAPQKGDQ
jgi:hypothetical protein